MVWSGFGVRLNNYGTSPQLTGPVRAFVMAAERVIPGLCGVLISNSPTRTIFTPFCFQSNMYPPSQIQGLRTEYPSTRF